MGRGSRLLALIGALAMLAGYLSPQTSLPVSADYSPPPYPTLCSGGVPPGFNGISIYSYGVQEYDFSPNPTSGFACLFPRGGLTESVQVVKPGQDITFTSTDPNPFWDAQTPHYLISQPYIQLGRLVGVKGAIGGNIDGYAGQPVSTEDGNTGWAQIKSGCQANDAACTISIPKDPVNGDGNGGAQTQAPAVRLNEWYTLDDISGGHNGAPAEIAFYLETGQPTALFTSATTDKPGAFGFRDASLPGFGNTLTKWAWTFGDGTSSSSQNPTHTYAKPGVYTVSLTVTDSSGSTDTVSHAVTLKAPSLDVNITFPGAPSGAPQANPGDSLQAEVTVSATDGFGDLSNLSFSGPLLQIDPQDCSVVSSGSANPGIFSLKPSSEVSYKFQLQAKTLGTCKLYSEVVGLDAGGTSISGSDKESFLVGHPLSVEVSGTPDKLQLKNGDDGSEIAQAVSIKVKVTNVSTKALDNVQLTDLEGVRGETADLNIPIICDRKPLNPQGNCAKGSDGKLLASSKLGTLAPGGSATVSLPFRAQGDGTGEIDAIATAIDPDSPKQLLQGFGSTRIVVKPTAILALAIHGPSGTGDLGTVVPGSGVDITGSLVNVTNAEQVDLDPLRPEITGNAGNGLPYDAGMELAPSGFPYPVTGEIDPGDDKTLDGTVTPAPTMTDAVPTGSLKYLPTGFVTGPDGTKTRLQAADSIIKPKGGELRLHVAGPPARASAADLASKTWYFSVGFFKGAVSWAENMVCALPSMLVTAAKFLYEAPVSLLQYIGYLATTWGYMRAQGKSDLFLGTIASEAAEHLNMKVEKVTTAMSAWLDHMEAAWNAGNSPEVYELAGEVGANVALEALLWYFTAGTGTAAEGGAHLVEESISLAEKEQGATLAKRISQDLRKVEPGDDLLALIERNGIKISALAADYGVSESEVQVALEIAKKMDVQIAFRPRNPLSIEHIVGALKAVVKPENFKVKTVSDLDIKYLGYPTRMTVDGVSTSSEGLLLMKKPVSEVELLRNLKGASGSDSAAAYRRWRARVAEWDKFEAGTDPHWQFKKWSDRGWVNIAHDREINGIGVPNGGSSNRKFQLTKLHDEATETYVFKIGDDAPHGGVLRPITGDIDCVAITRPDGSELTAQERLAVYEALQNSPFQMQHGEELSWINQGEKYKLLSDHFPGGEPLAFVMPDGKVRAGFINPALTTVGKSTGATHLRPIIWADGAEYAPLVPPVGPPPTNLPTF